MKIYTNVNYLIRNKTTVPKKIMVCGDNDIRENQEMFQINKKGKPNKYLFIVLS